MHDSFLQYSLLIVNNSRSHTRPKKKPHLFIRHFSGASDVFTWFIEPHLQTDKISVLDRPARSNMCWRNPDVDHIIQGDSLTAGTEELLRMR